MLKYINKKLHTPTWLFILLVGVLLLRIPSFFEPYSYGDEMIYLTLGEAIRQKVPLYGSIHDNKPPLLYIAAAVAGSLFWFKAILAFWNLITIYLFWKFVEKLFPKKTRLHKIATLIFAIYTTIPRLEGNIANAENFMLGFTIAGFLVILSPSFKDHFKKLNAKKLLIAGVLFSFATLFKVPAAFDIPAIIFLWFCSVKLSRPNITKIVKYAFWLSIGFLIPIVVSLAYYYFQGAFQEYLVAAFLQNVGYLSSWRPDDVQLPFLQKNGPLLARGTILTTSLLILYLKRAKLSKQFIFLSTWLLLSLFAVTLSERPYPHYLLQSMPPISILAAMLFSLKTMEQILVIIPLAIAFYVPVHYEFWSYPTLSYYQRFLNLATGQISESEYLNTFGGHVERNYKIADYLISTTKRNEKVFVWGDSSAIYALSRRLPPTRYVADYHFRDFSTPQLTIEVLEKDFPTVVVVLPDSDSFPALGILLRSNYAISEEIGGAKIWKLLSPKVRSLIAS